MNKIIAYVDGSYNPSINKYAFGCIIVREREGEESEKETLDTFEAFLEEEESCEVVTTLKGSGSNPEVAKIRNVAGEMLGAMNAVRWARKQGYDALDIYYDYAGIEMWATGKWKAKNEYTQSYAEYMKKSMAEIDIQFKKVEAHTGNKYNEQADKLAKSALESDSMN